MRQIAVFAIAVLIVLILVMANAQAQERRIPGSQGEIQLSFAPIVREAAPAVVNVYSRRVVRQRRSASPFFDDPFFRRFFGERGFGIPRQRVQQSLGSGVIVSEDGYVVTNHHVIRGGTEIQVVLADRREFEAKVVIKDEQTDLAVMKINAPGEKFPFLALQDSDDLEVGDLVLAIGNPFGVGQTVTSGIVSALARSRVGVSDFQSFIQTDAAINPGNSGGALINMAGNLIGINTAIFSRSGGSNGIGFAVPSNMARVVIDAARGGGKIRRPWFGAEMQPVTQDIADSLGLARPTGAMVKFLHPKGAAAQAGLKRGDIIVEIDGRAINQPADFNYRFATYKIGGTAAVRYLRSGKSRSADVPIMAPVEDPPRNATVVRGRNPFAGATIANLSPALALELKRNIDEAGVVVLKAGRGTARRLGFRRGDIIVAVEERRMRSVRDVVRAVRKRQPDWIITIKRGDRVFETTVDG